jgi:hypothetical protein
VNVKAGDVKGKVTIENDWDDMGRFEAKQGTSTVVTGVTNTATGAVSTTQASRLGLREAWMLFKVPYMPFALKGGHQFLQLGNGWFFRANKYGSDAWIVLSEIDTLHLALFDVKVSEGNRASSDDIDAYGIVATNKFGDITAGVNITLANDRRNVYGFNTPGFGTKAQNIGLHGNGKVGPVGLKAEIDVQTGKAEGAAGERKFKGNQIVIQGDVKLDPVTVDFTVARGSGNKIGDNDWKQMVTFMDFDPHYTVIYEYRVAGPCGIHTGFCNTTAISGGAKFKATKSLTIGGSLWFLMATEDVPDVISTTAGATTDELGMEVDLKLKWQLYENLAWSWSVGYLDPGKGLGKDPATAIQGKLSMNF